jgi:hypothetical protein
VTRVRDEFDVPAAGALPGRGQDLTRLEVARHAEAWEPAEVGPDGRQWEGEPAPAEPDVFPPDRIDPDDAESDPELWDEGFDDHIWNLGPDDTPAEPSAADLADYRDWSREASAREHLDASERLTLAELTDRQVAFFRGWSNPAGAMFADALGRLALQIRMTDATTPAELEARIEVLDAGIREQFEAIGYEDGRASCRHEPGAAFGHSA